MMIDHNVPTYTHMQQPLMVSTQLPSRYESRVHPRGAGSERAALRMRRDSSWG